MSYHSISILVRGDHIPHIGIDCPYGADGRDRNEATCCNSNSTTWCKTSFVGGNNSVNLLTPYIVLIWCVKQ